jgi:methionine aminotransferase
MPIFNQTIPSKLPQVGTSIFTVMSKLATDHQAINLSQGFPDFNISSELVSLVNKYMNSGMNQYAPMQGLLALREVISAKFKKLYNIEYDPEKEITVTAGGTQALYSSISALIREGDEVLIFTPAYDSYEPAVTLHKGITRYVQLTAPDFKINWKEVKKTVNSKTRMIILNSPHNPSGAVLSPSDIKELEKIVKGTGIIILSDEVYEHLIFDGQKHLSMATSPELASRSIIVASFGKIFHVTGWKMGYMVGPANLMAEVRKAHQYQVFCCNTPAQHAIAEYLKEESTYLELNDFYQAKRDYFLNGIKDSRFLVVPTKGTYFQLLDYSPISKENDVDFAKRLTTEYKLASIPISVFYNTKTDQHLLRFCFAKKEETLDKAIEILDKI